MTSRGLAAEPRGEGAQVEPGQGVTVGGVVGVWVTAGGGDGVEDWWWGRLTHATGVMGSGATNFFGWG
jgi:hypothetical protein